MSQLVQQRLRNVKKRTVMHVQSCSFANLKRNSLYRAVRFAKFEGIWGFSILSILLVDLLGNTCLLARAQKVLVRGS